MGIYNPRSEESNGQENRKLDVNSGLQEQGELVHRRHQSHSSENKIALRGLLACVLRVLDAANMPFGTLNK